MRIKEPTREQAEVRRALYDLIEAHGFGAVIDGLTFHVGNSVLPGTTERTAKAAHRLWDATKDDLKRDHVDVAVFDNFGY